MFLTGFSLLSPASTNQARGYEMLEQIKAARAEALQYEGSKELVFLQKAGEKLEGVDLLAVQGGEQRAEARLQTWQTWVFILVRIDAVKDPDFDPNDPPVTKVSPRAIPGAHPYMPGVPPEMVRDPQIRAEYEQAIKQNNEKIRKAKFYWQLKALDIEVSEGARRFVKRFYTPSTPDQKELRIAMEKAGLNTHRRQSFADLHKP